LNGVVELFRELGHGTKAEDLIRFYVDQRSEDKDLFDLGKFPVGHMVKDSALRTAFNEKLAAFSSDLDAAEILNRIGSRGGWNPEEITMLSSLSAQEYRQILEENNGLRLRAILSAALQFGTFLNASDEMKEISRRAREALKIIGQESAINRLRVRPYGIDLAETAEAVSPDSGENGADPEGAE